MATLQNDPWQENPVPRFKSLAQLHAWIAPLLAEENKGRFTGNPCLQPQDFGGNAPEKSPTAGTNWVLGWLKAMCKGRPYPSVLRGTGPKGRQPLQPALHCGL